MLVGQTIGSGDHRFDIEDELGSGAMGTVYRATFHDKGKVRPVALKVVALGLLGNEGAMARFTREANILKQLTHPHIVKLYATGHYRKTPFIAMEFIDGEPMDRALARRGRMSWEEVVRYGKQLCEALQYAHDKGIIHRDLKPSNLMIAGGDDKNGILKLTDFGIAKDTDVTALTGANSTIGTAAYMSPEQCKGDKNLTFKSDLYSLGIVFFELLTGRKPFTAESTVDMFLKHVNEPPPRVGKLVQDLPPKFDALIWQLMEKDKDDRPMDAAWVVRMLTEIEEDAFTRKSAGLDAATAKRGDRRRDPAAPPIDAADRDAARALKGEKKKKKKRKSVPLVQRPWFKAAGLLLALAAIGTAVFFALRPPSADKLYAAVAEAKTPDAKLDAAATYLKTHGDKPGEKTEAAAAAFREGKVREREKQLANRFGAKMSKPDENDDKEAYEYAWQAMQFERDGNLRTAADLWNKVRARFAEEGKLPFTFEEQVLAKARWTWVADKRIRDIAAVEEQGRKLGAKIDESRRFELPIVFDPSNPESEATRALRLERFGDHDKAARQWQILIDQTEKEAEQRVWFLLACERRAAAVKQAPENAVAHRQGLVRGKIAEAEKDAKPLKNEPDKKAERAGVRIQCRDVVELYDDESDKPIADAVRRAKEIIADLPKT